MPDIIETYNHNGKIGVLVQFRCKDDFALRTDEFKDVAKGIAMHIAASKPSVVAPSELSPKTRNEELALIRDKVRNLDAESQLQEIDKANRRIDQQYCLVSQSYLRNPNQTVGELLSQLSASLRVPVDVIRFVRWYVNET